VLVESALELPSGASASPEKVTGAEPEGDDDDDDEDDGAGDDAGAGEIGGVAVSDSEGSGLVKAASTEGPSPGSSDPSAAAGAHPARSSTVSRSGGRRM